MKEKLLKFLSDLDQIELVQLLEHSEFRPYRGTGVFDEPVKYIEVISPPSFSEALSGLSPRDKKRILDALGHAEPVAVDEWSEPDHLFFKAAGDDPEEGACLLPALIAQRNVMIDVATGGARFNDVDDYYKVRRKRITRLLAERGLENPNPFEGLWDWYRHWQSEGMDTYADRRHFIYDLFRPVVSSVLGAPAPPPSAPRPPTGWPRVDRAVAKAKDQLAAAKDEEDFQAIGFYCREILISLGQAVFDPEEHVAPDGVVPSPTDAKRRLEGFLAGTVPGERNETVRRHAKASLALALDLQHRRTADRRMALLCLEATASTVAVISILSGRWAGPELDHVGSAAADRDAEA